MVRREPWNTFDRSITINRPPEALWDFFRDVSNDVRWRTGVDSAAWTSDPPHGVGSTGLHVVERVGDWPWQVTDWEEARLMGWEVTGGRFKGSHGAYGIAPEDGGCRVTIHTSVRPGAFTRVVMLLMKRTMVRQADADLVELKAIMEARV